MKTSWGDAQSLSVSGQEESGTRDSDRSSLAANHQGGKRKSPFRLYFSLEREKQDGLALTRPEKSGLLCSGRVPYV